MPPNTPQSAPDDSPNGWDFGNIVKTLFNVREGVVAEPIHSVIDVTRAVVKAKTRLGLWVAERIPGFGHIITPVRRRLEQLFGGFVPENGNYYQQAA